MKNIFSKYYYSKLIDNNKYHRYSGFYFTTVYKQIIPLIGVYRKMEDV